MFALQLAYQPLITPAPLRLFRPLINEATVFTASHPSSSSSSTSSPSTSSLSSASSPQPTRSSSFRLRRGRGGIIRLDRRVDSRTAPASTAKPRGIPAPSWRDERKRERGEPLLTTLFADEWSLLPSIERRRIKSDDDEPGFTGVDMMEGVIEGHANAKTLSEDVEYGRRISERWRYDSEAGVVGVGMGMQGLEDEERVIIDDFEERYVVFIDQDYSSLDMSTN